MNQRYHSLETKKASTNVPCRKEELLSCDHLLCILHQKLFRLMADGYYTFYMRPEIWLKLFLFNSVFDSLSRTTQDSDITHFKTNTINFYNKFNLLKAKNTYLLFIKSNTFNYLIYLINNLIIFSNRQISGVYQYQISAREQLRCHKEVLQRK